MCQEKEKTSFPSTLCMFLGYNSSPPQATDHADGAIVQQQLEDQSFPAPSHNQQSKESGTSFLELPLLCFPLAVMKQNLPKVWCWLARQNHIYFGRTTYDCLKRTSLSYSDGGWKWYPGLCKGECDAWNPHPGLFCSSHWCHSMVGEIAPPSRAMLEDPHRQMPLFQWNFIDAAFVCQWSSS